MHSMLSTSGLIHCPVIPRVCQNMKHHMNFKQRRNANSKDRMKKQLSVKNFTIHFPILVFHEFNSLVKHMVKCVPGLINLCMVLNHQFLLGMVINSSLWKASWPLCWRPKQIFPKWKPQWGI